MAIPSVGGMAVQLITFLLAPCLYCLVKEWQFRHGWLDLPEADAAPANETPAEKSQGEVQPT